MCHVYLLHILQQSPNLVVMYSPTLIYIHTYYSYMYAYIYIHTYIFLFVSCKQLQLYTSHWRKKMNENDQGCCQNCTGPIAVWLRSSVNTIAGCVTKEKDMHEHMMLEGFRWSIGPLTEISRRKNSWEGMKRLGS